MEMHGVSMDYTFDADGESKRTTQYFEILGNRAIYHDGWVAACFHGRLPWIRLQGFEFDGEQERWELYDIRNDFSQAFDLAEKHPEKLSELLEKFDEEARRFGVYPLRDVSSPRAGEFGVPSLLGERTSMTYTPAHELTININRQLFDWVLENLLKNALDAMGGEGSIHIAVSTEGTKVAIDVTDTGSGVPKGKFETIFEPGYSTKRRGWGLGLSLTKRIVEEYHKGKIFVKHSEVGKGTTFRILLPMG